MHGIAFAEEGYIIIESTVKDMDLCPTRVLFSYLPISWLHLSIILWSHIVLIVVVHTMYMYFY